MARLSNVLFVFLMVAMVISGCDKVNPPNYGCTDPLALNFDPDATLDDGNCEYDSALLRGCTDTLASNYDPLALIDDCKCRYDSLRTVLVEDYTGFRCPNCPRAAETLHELECLYGARVVPIAVHVSESFAAPQNNPDGSFATDFRTSIGNTYEAEFGTGLFLPNGMVNRTKFNDAFAQLHADWPGQVATILAQPAEALVFINTTYDEGTRLATADVSVLARTNLADAPYRIVVLLTEDSVVDWQIDNALNPPKISDYVHNHVLRDGFTDAWGDALNGGAALSSGYTENNTFTLTLDANYRANQCNVVAFVFRDDTKQVIQAAYVPIIEQ